MKFRHRLTGLLLVAALLVSCGSTPTPEPAPEPAATPVAEAEAEVSEASGPTSPEGEAAQEEVAAEIPTMSENAVTTESGLQFEDFQTGDGPVVGFNTWAVIDYETYLEDGTLVDSSYWYDDPYGFLMGAGQVPQGWEEGIAGMMPGGVRRLMVPAALAYGEAGTEAIPANSNVIYNIEVLRVDQYPNPTPADGFKETESGVRYAILQEGEGETEAELGDIILMDYDAWWENGIIFYRSSQYDYSAELTLGQSSIAGLNEGMVGMKEGEIRQLHIPAELAYGETGWDTYVPPNTAIIIEVMLHDDMKLPKQSSIKEDDLETSESGLQYAVLAKGTGDAAKEGDLVSATYSGWLEDGTLFDSSVFYEGAPFVFTLGSGEAIAGWDEGLAGMKVGEKRQLRVPAALAYGEVGLDQIVPPNANLIFDVEIVEVQGQ